jgi:hypothetical protein
LLFYPKLSFFLRKRRAAEPGFGAKVYSAILDDIKHDEIFQQQDIKILENLVTESEASRIYEEISPCTIVIGVAGTNRLVMMKWLIRSQSQ